MRFFVLASVTTVTGVLIACSSDTTNTNNTNTGDGGVTSSSGGSSGASSSGGSSGGSSGAPTKQAASTTEAPVSLDTACAAFTACGGDLSGTYDYEKGCLGDLLGQARAQCKEIDTTALKATVKGSIYFLAGGILERDVTSTIAGTVTFPVSCTQGLGCAVGEQLLKSELPNIKCTEASGTCTCTASRTETNTAATTFKVAGNTVTTADGDEYDFCVAGSALTYSGKTKEAEDGTWTLKKR